MNNTIPNTSLAKLLPDVFIYQFSQNYITVRFPFTHSENVVENVAENVVENVAEKNKDLLSLIIENNSASAKDYAKMLNVSPRTIQRKLVILQKNGIIRRFGPDKGGYWAVIKK